MQRIAMNNTIRNCLFIMCFGFVSLLFSAMALLLTFGGHGFYTPLIIISSPIFGILGVKAIFIAPLLWMIEIILCLRKTWWCCMLFMLLVASGYIESIYMLKGYYFCDLQKCIRAWEAGYLFTFTIMLAIYTTTQISLWALLIRTWSSKISK